MYIYMCMYIYIYKLYTFFGGYIAIKSYFRQHFRMPRGSGRARDWGHSALETRWCAWRARPATTTRAILLPENSRKMTCGDTWRHRTSRPNQKAMFSWSSPWFSWRISPWSPPFSVGKWPPWPNQPTAAGRNKKQPQGPKSSIRFGVDFSQKFRAVWISDGSKVRWFPESLGYQKIAGWFRTWKIPSRSGW